MCPGWKHFLRGQIATLIIECQEQCHRDRERPAKDTGKTWAKNLINQSWGHFYEAWKFRCDERHELDGNKASKQRRACACCTALPGLPIAICSNHCFQKTQNQQLDQETRKTEDWLIHAEPLTQQGLAKKEQLADALPDVRDCFPALTVPM
jgi:hypothetical protein